MIMNKKKYLIIPIIVALLIIGFSLACGGTNGEAETTKVVKEPVEVKEEPVEEAISDEALKDEEYITGMLVLSYMITETADKCGTAAFNCADGLISIEEFKVQMSEYVLSINTCYDVYLDLEPTERFESTNEQMGEAMKHYLNSATYMEQVVKTDDIEKMTDYLEQATSEIKLGTTYIEKATAEASKLIE